MCLSTSASLIQDVVAKFVSENQLFTAFDVTIEVKASAAQRGDPVERHQEMRNTIHDEVQQYLDDGRYARTLRDVGAQTPAFVYYPVGTDPSTYIPRPRRDKPNPVVIAPPVVVPPTQDAFSQPDARGSLLVPASFLRKVGFKHGDTAQVYSRQCVGTPVLAVTKNVPLGHSALATYTVDYHDNIRITGVQLIAGGIQSSKYDFTIDGTGTEVFVWGR